MSSLVLLEVFSPAPASAKEKLASRFDRVYEQSLGAFGNIRAKRLNLLL